MTHRFDYRSSSTGVNVDINYLFVANTDYTIANNLFYGTGSQLGTFGYIQATPTGNEWVYFDSALSTTGVIGLSDPETLGENYTRDRLGTTLPASFDASTDFTGLFGSRDNIDAYFRLFGIAAPTLTWNNTAIAPDVAVANAIYAANLEASAAHHAAQLDAILATIVTNPIEFVAWNNLGLLNTSTSPRAPGFVMRYTPSEGTALTYGDFLVYVQDEFARTRLYSQAGMDSSGNIDGALLDGGLGGIFGADETVHLILTADDDLLNGTSMSAGTLIIDLGAGDDTAQLFYDDRFELPEVVRIDAGTGNDTLSLGAFFDTEIILGAGNDIVNLQAVGFGALRSDGSPHRHYVEGGDGDDYILCSQDFARLFAEGGDGADIIFGGTWNDTLDGGLGRDFLVGGAGDDLLTGGGSADTLIGGDGNDSIFGGEGRDFLDGGAGNDRLNGGTSADTLIGGEGADRLEGETGADSLSGGSGNDTLIGGSGADTLEGGSGNDTLEGGSGRDLLSGDSGDDLLNGGSENDTLLGGSGNDTLIGASGDDVLDGGTGDDVLEGGSGRDTLTGGGGNDTLTGGGGADVFVFADGFGNDVVTDFQNGTDRFDFRGHSASNFAQLTVTNSGGNATISDGLGNTILVQGAAGLIDAGDFLF